MGDEFLKFNKIAPLVVGAGFFLWGSPVHASEIEQQMKQNQDQLNQVHQQTQTFLSQIEHYLQEMNENKTKEEDFEKAVLKEKDVYQKKEQEIEKLRHKYNRLSKSNDEILTPKELKKKTNQLIDLKDKIRFLDEKAEKYLKIIEGG